MSIVFYLGTNIQLMRSPWRMTQTGISGGNVHGEATLCLGINERMRKTVEEWVGNKENYWQGDRMNQEQEEWECSRHLHHDTHTPIHTTRPRSTTLWQLRARCFSHRSVYRIYLWAQSQYLREYFQTWHCSLWGRWSWGLLKLYFMTRQLCFM